MSHRRLMRRNASHSRGAKEALYGREVQRLLRRRYSLGEELSLLRRREECPEEFAAYYQYAEACKEKAKEILREEKEG